MARTLAPRRQRPPVISRSAPPSQSKRTPRHTSITAPDRDSEPDTVTERSAAAARVHNRPGSWSTDRASSSRQLGALDTPQPHESRLGIPTALTTVSADPPSPSNISSRRAPGQHPSRTPGAVSFEPDGGAPDGLSARSERTLAPPPRSPRSINHPGERHSRPTTGGVFAVKIFPVEGSGHRRSRSIGDPHPRRGAKVAKSRNCRANRWTAGRRGEHTEPPDR